MIGWIKIKGVEHPMLPPIDEDMYFIIAIKDEKTGKYKELFAPHLGDGVFLYFDKGLPIKIKADYWLQIPELKKEAI